ncbi:MAG: hypothetical protein QOK08_1294 [Actinomycetota bacterium]|jgi:hypothetical protein|nr:hypothetical protein [Actinomycetota bacterium]MDQ1574018.1 hypothetical protein [Actinomycetota bacterium]
MDLSHSVWTLSIIVWVVLPCLVLLLLYCVIRVAVARGLRDHQLWMEKNRPVIAQPQSDGYGSPASRPLV